MHNYGPVSGAGCGGEERAVESNGSSLLLQCRDESTDLGVRQAWVPILPLPTWLCTVRNLLNLYSFCTLRVNQDSAGFRISWAWSGASHCNRISANVNWLPFAWKCQKKTHEFHDTAFVIHLTANEELRHPYIWYNLLKCSCCTIFKEQWHLRHLVLSCRLLTGCIILNPLKRISSFSAWPVWWRCPRPVYSSTRCMIEPHTPYTVPLAVERYVPQVASLTLKFLSATGFPGAHSVHSGILLIKPLFRILKRAHQRLHSFASRTVIL